MAVPNPSGNGAPEFEADLYKLTMEEERRSVDLQRARLDNIRSRSIQYLTYVGASSGFLVGSSLNAETSKTPAFIVVAVLGSVLWMITAICALLVITARPPRRVASAGWRKVSVKKLEWDWGLMPGAVLKMAEQQLPRTRPKDLSRQLAKEYASSARANRTQLVWMEKWYSIFIALASSQLGIWLLLAWIKV